MAKTAEQFLMGGGGGAPGVKFTNIGDSVSGIVTDEPKVQPQFKYNKPGEVETWPSGDPIEQLLIPLYTQLRDPAIEDDDGQRTLYVKGNGRALREALKEAISAAGARGAEIGGVLTVQYSGGKGVEGDPKQYRAQYQRPTPETLQIVQQINGQQAQTAQQGFLQGGQPQQPAPAQPNWGAPPPVSPAWGQQAQPTPQPAQAQQPTAWAANALAAGLQGQPLQQPSAPVAPPQQPAQPAAGMPQPGQPGFEAVLASVKQANIDPQTLWPGYQG